MPIGVLQIVPGGSQEQYERIGERIFGARSSEFSPRNAPEGLIMHSAGPTDEGWWVYDIWESQAHLERFLDERFMPAARELGGPPPDKPQIFQVYNLVQVARR